MGFFSWKTQDTDKSIPNIYNDVKDTFSVTMTDNKGNRWHEPQYDGYGEFGGKDFYELLAEMNGKKGRDEGISLFFGNEPFKSPNLSENDGWEWVDNVPEDCEFQGFFYGW